MYELAEEIKQAFYCNRASSCLPALPLNYCVNGCVYCPYHMKNKHIARIKLTQEEIKREVIALQDMGHKRLAIEAGEDRSTIRSSTFWNPSKQSIPFIIKTVTSAA